MKIYLSKYALTKGITELDAVIKGDSAYPGRPFMSFVSFALGKDAHHTREEAVAAAENMRKQKISALKKQIAKLEKMSFDEVNS